MPSIKDREIFSIGTWKGSSTVTATETMLAEIVAAYTELNSKVSGFAIPLKLGHNKRVGEPAFGYAENIRMTDAGTLIADFNDVPPEIVDAIDKKKYNAVSVEIWPSVTYSGKTYPNVLGGVALLGAEWPAVKGLKPLSMFAEGEQPIQLSKEEEMPNFTQEQHDAAVAAAVAQANLSADAARTELTARADRAEAALQAFRDEVEKSEVTAVIEAAEAAGKIVPANKPAVVAMAEAIRLSVDPAKRKDALATFKAFVEAMPKKVDFKEATASDQTRTGDGANAGEKVDAAAKKLLTEKKATNYREALDMVFAADPALKTAYAEENR